MKKTRLFSGKHRPLADVVPIGVEFKKPRKDVSEKTSLPTPELGTEDAVWDAMLTDDKDLIERAIDAVPDDPNPHP